jgi:hypothetical protein
MRPPPAAAYRAAPYAQAFAGFLKSDAASLGEVAARAPMVIVASHVQVRAPQAVQAGRHGHLATTLHKASRAHGAGGQALCQRAVRHCSAGQLFVLNCAAHRPGQLNPALHGLAFDLSHGRGGGSAYGARYASGSNPDRQEP